MIRIIKNTFILATAIIMSYIMITSFHIKVAAKSLDKNNSRYSATMEQLQNNVLDYFEKHNISYKIGSPEYLDYITDQLLYGTDQEIKKLDNYDLITAYFVHYKNVYGNAIVTDPSGSLAEESVKTDEFLNTTVDMLKKEFSGIIENNDPLSTLRNNLGDILLLIPLCLPLQLIMH